MSLMNGVAGHSPMVKNTLRPDNNMIWLTVGRVYYRHICILLLNVLAGKFPECASEGSPRCGLLENEHRKEFVRMCDPICGEKMTVFGRGSIPMEMPKGF